MFCATYYLGFRNIGVIRFNLSNKISENPILKHTHLNFGRFTLQQQHKLSKNRLRYKKSELTKLRCVSKILQTLISISASHGVY